MKQLHETDLYEPVKKYFERLGYIVRSEVINCDVVCINNDSLIIVEMKTSFNLKLVYQAIERQSSADFVYVAVPRPKSFNSKSFRNMCILLKRLNIGLIAITCGKRKGAEIIYEPIDIHTGRRNNIKRNIIINEAKGRTADINTGGSTGKKIMTAYRERVIHAACMLELLDTAKISFLVQNGCHNTTGNILRSDYYGWFKRVKTGYYALTEKGKNELNNSDYTEIINFYRKEALKCLKSEETTNAGAEAEKNIKSAMKEVTRKF